LGGQEIRVSKGRSWVELKPKKSRLGGLLTGRAATKGGQEAKAGVTTNDLLPKGSVVGPLGAALADLWHDRVGRIVDRRGGLQPKAAAPGEADPKVKGAELGHRIAQKRWRCLEARVCYDSRPISGTARLGH